MDAHKRRRDEDLRKIGTMAQEYPGIIEIVGSSGSPISQIRLRLKVPTAPNERYPREVQSVSDIRIDLPSSYPIRPPIVTVTSPAWNPNIFQSGLVCLGRDWVATQGLDLLILRVIKILAFDPLIVNTIHPANAQAAAWYNRVRARQPDAFPTVNTEALKGERPRPGIGWRNLEEPPEQVVIDCVACKAKLRVDKGKRLRVRCPKCSTVFEVRVD